MSRADCFKVTESDWTIYHIAQLKERYLTLITERGELGLDLDAVESIDTAGIQLLLFLGTEARRSGKDFSVVSASAPVRNLVELFGVEEVLMLEGCA